MGVDGASSSPPPAPQFLIVGADLSTQQLKLVVIEEGTENFVTSVAVHFERELSEFGTRNGAIERPDGTVRSPVLMWVSAVEMAFEKLVKSGIDCSKIRAIGGGAQQHGTVFWSKDGVDTLGKLDAERKLVEQLQNGFTLLESPMWMDSSTGDECLDLEKAVGGAQALANITGSRAFHRFSGSQIAKVRKDDKDRYEQTERISLVSSFFPSLLVGKIVDIDWGDATGMNLFDISTKEWSRPCLASVAGSQDPIDIDRLARKLGSPQRTCTAAGKIARFWSTKFGLSPDCVVTHFTGDNQSSLAGLRIAPGDLGVSLGTSGSFFGIVESPKPSTKGHIMIEPTDGFMVMVCFKNGSLTRERVKAQYAKDWDDFDRLLSKTTAGNNGNVGFFFDHDEIAPNVKAGDYKFDEHDTPVEEFAPEVTVRAVIESQCLAKRLYAKNLGFEVPKNGKIIVAGGASVNRSLARILADVFGRPVFRIHDTSEAAALGGALVAKRVIAGRIGSTPDREKIAEPNMENHEIYTKLLSRYEKLEGKVVEVAENEWH